MTSFTRAFTLIELLVVVTIIVVLLALLTPALDRAIYQAELTVCGAQLKGVGTGANSYAMSFKRYYPHRTTMTDPKVGNCFIRNLTLPAGVHNKTTTNYDDRPTIRDHISIKSLQCPLGGEADLAVSPPTTYVYSSYAMWFGVKYRAAGGGAGMMKLGDKIGWAGRKFSPLAGDWFIGGFAVITSAHPDDLGGLGANSRQDQNDANLADGPYTLAEWRGDIFQAPVGPVDLNYAFTDGSVERRNGVRWLDVGTNAQDGIKQAPSMPHATAHGGDWLAIPSR